MRDAHGRARRGLEDVEARVEERKGTGGWKQRYAGYPGEFIVCMLVPLRATDAHASMGVSLGRDD